MLINFQMYFLFLFSFLYLIFSFLPLWSENMVNIALAVVAQFIHHWPVNKGSAVQSPVRTHAWVAGQVPQLGAHERQPHTVSLLFFLLLQSL